MKIIEAVVLKNGKHPITKSHFLLDKGEGIYIKYKRTNNSLMVHHLVLKLKKEFGALIVLEATSKE